MSSIQTTNDDQTPLPQPIPGLDSDPDAEWQRMLGDPVESPTAVQIAFDQLQLTFTSPSVSLPESREKIDDSPTFDEENPVNNTPLSPEEEAWYSHDQHEAPPPECKEERRPNSKRVISPFRRFKRKIEDFHLDIAPWIGWVFIVIALGTSIAYGVFLGMKMHRDAKAYRRSVAQIVPTQKPTTTSTISIGSNAPIPTKTGVTSTTSSVTVVIPPKPAEDLWVEHEVRDNEWSIPILRQHGYKKEPDQQAAFKLMLEEPRNAKIKKLTNNFNDLLAGQTLWIPKTLQATVTVVAK